MTRLGSGVGSIYRTKTHQRCVRNQIYWQYGRCQAQVLWESQEGPHLLRHRVLEQNGAIEPDASAAF